MTEPVVRLSKLTKRFGHTTAVGNLNLEVQPGEVLGLLGPNGAGKSTTFRLILDLIRPTAGTISVFGLDATQRGIEVRSRIGYLPGELSFPARLTAGEFLERIREIRGLGQSADLAALAERFDLHLDRRIAELSKGNRQKLGLIQACFHHPELLVLDEPTSGLDPFMQREFRDLVRERVQQGTTVLLSSHVLGEVEQMATAVAVLRAGSVVVVSRVDDLRTRAVRRVRVRFASEPIASDFQGVPGMSELKVEGQHMSFIWVGEIDALIKLLSRYRVIALDLEEPDLEEVFLKMYEQPSSPERDPNDG